MDVVRVDFALIPDDPLFGGVVSASQAITAEFHDNQNIIDDTHFPPHVSLHICTLPRDTVAQAVDDLYVLAEEGDLPGIAPIRVDAAQGGYVMLHIERTAEIMSLHEAILGVSAAARDGLDGDAYGNRYIRDSFTPHLSLAKVDHRDLSHAVDIGRKVLGESRASRARTLDLCDLGSRSERWNVLASFQPRRLNHG